MKKRPFYQQIRNNLRFMSRWRKVMTAPFQPLSRLRVEQGHQLRKSLQYAQKHVPFYHELFADQNFSPDAVNSSADLESLPLIRKMDVQQDPQRFFSDEYVPTDLTNARTSGTIGLPLQIFFDDDVIIETSLLTHREEAAWKSYLGETPRKMSILVPSSFANQVRNDTYKILWIPGGVKNPRINISTDMTPLEHIEAIKQQKPNVLEGYGSVIERIFRYQQDHQIQFPAPRVVLILSEDIQQEVKKALEEQWQAKIFSRYSLTECIKVGYECEYGLGYHIHTDFCAVRIVDEEGQDMPEGETGTVVVTTLKSKAMPFTNYYSGDLAAIDSSLCPCGRTQPRLVNIQGRMAEVIRLPNDRYIRSLTLVRVEHHPDVRQFQIIRQGEVDFRVLIIPHPGGDEEGMVHHVQSIFDEHAGDVVNISVEFVDELITTDRQKQPMYLSHYQPEKND
jgi:phenylacetate-CoA ligase